MFFSMLLPKTLFLSVEQGGKMDLAPTAGARLESGLKNQDVPIKVTIDIGRENSCRCFESAEAAMRRGVT